MGLMDEVQRNVPKVELGEYSILLSGQPKSGKTTLFADLILEHYGDTDKGLLLAFEPGYKALDINKIDIKGWSHFEEVADMLVEEKETLTFKLIGLDTVDVLYTLAEEKVINEWNSKNPNKMTKDIGGVGAKGNSDQGFGAGHAEIKKKIRKVLTKLQSAGYGIFSITHSKDKTVEQHDGTKFDQLNLSLPTSAREIFVNNADFIVFLTSNKIKGKKGVEQNRLMHFRSDGYVEAGSRFPNVPDSVKYGAKEFLEVFKNAIEAGLKGKGDITKLAQEQESERDTKAKAYRESLKTETNTEDSDSDAVEKVRTNIANLVTDMSRDNKVALAKKFKEEFKDADYRKLTALDDLNKALEITQELVDAAA